MFGFDKNVLNRHTCRSMKLFEDGKWGTRSNVVKSPFLGDIGERLGCKLRPIVCYNTIRYAVLREN